MSIESAKLVYNQTNSIKAGGYIVTETAGNLALEKEASSKFALPAFRARLYSGFQAEKAVCSNKPPFIPLRGK